MVYVKIVNKEIQWNFDFKNLYTTKYSVEQMVFLAPEIVQYVKNNLDEKKPPYSGYNLPVPWAFLNIEVPQ